MRPPRRPLLLAVLLAAGCPEENKGPPGPAPDRTCPEGSPLPCQVLLDETNNNSVDYHVLVADGAKHDDAQKLLEHLYRHTSKRREDEPAGVAVYVYTTEAAFRTPPRTPVAQVVRKAGELGPKFENRIPLEFWQEVEQALLPPPIPGQEGPRVRRDAKWNLKLKVERDDAQKTLVLTQPYTEPGEDKWAATLSFNQAMQEFADAARALFEEVPDLKGMTFVGTWKDKEVVRIQLSRADYNAVKLGEIDERIGQHHGRVFLELSTGRASDQAAAKTNANLIAKEYRAMLAQLKGKATVSPTLK